MVVLDTGKSILGLSNQYKDFRNYVFIFRLSIMIGESKRFLVILNWRIGDPKKSEFCEFSIMRRKIKRLLLTVLRPLMVHLLGTVWYLTITQYETWYFDRSYRVL